MSLEFDDLLLAVPHLREHAREFIFAARPAERSIDQLFRLGGGASPVCCRRPRAGLCARPSSTPRWSLAGRDRAVVVVAHACAIFGLELVLPAVLAAMVELRVFLQYRLEVRLRRRARAEEIVRTSARAAVSHGDGSGANARRLAGWAGAR